MTTLKPDTCQAASFAGGTLDASALPLSTVAGDKATIAFWMKWNGSDGVVPFSFATEGLAFSGGGFGFTSSNNDIYGIASASLANSWHHVVAEFTNGNIAADRLYVDGALQTLTQRSGAANNANALTSGEYRFGGQVGTTANRFGGALDEAFIFDGVVSPAYASYLATTPNACAPVTVELLLPATNSEYNTPASISYRAVARSQTGIINAIDLYNGATMVASAATGYVWVNPSPGTYSLTAKATDSIGASAFSAPVTVTVNNVVGTSTVSIATPAQGGTFYTSGTVHFGATAIPAPSYDIARVEFYANGQEIGWTTTAPYDFTWRYPTAGTYTITVNVIDDAGYVTSSAPITITVVEGVPAVTYYYNDVAGTPISATDGNGNVIWDESYEPYGARYSNEDTTTQNGLWYTGKPTEDATGLSYYGGRWYNPTIGRFYGTDPFRFIDNNPLTFNRYAYGNNNPYRFVDPDGRDPIPMMESEVRAMYRSRDGGGHHIFSRANAIRFRDLLSRDTVELAGREYKIGVGTVSRRLEGDPHSYWTLEHQASDKAIERALPKYVAEHGISPQNPMTPEQFNDFMGQARRLPEVAKYNNTIIKFQEEQVRAGRGPNVKQILRGSRAIGGGIEE